MGERILKSEYAGRLELAKMRIHRLEVDLRKGRESVRALLISFLWMLLAACIGTAILVKEFCKIRFRQESGGRYGECTGRQVSSRR